jgi:hypothetical protein
VLGDFEGMNMNFCISDFFTFLLSIFGIALSLYYILKQWFSPIGLSDKELEKKLSDWLKDWWNTKELNKAEKLDVILGDYTATLTEIAGRDNVTLLTGTILVTSSLIILGNAALAKPDFPIYVCAFASIGLFSTWLVFLHETAKKLNTLSYIRTRAIEQAITQNLNYPFGIHSYIYEVTGKMIAPWLRMRRRIFWYCVLLLLSFAWVLLTIRLRLF